MTKDDQYLILRTNNNLSFKRNKVNEKYESSPTMINTFFTVLMGSVTEGSTIRRTILVGLSSPNLNLSTM